MSAKTNDEQILKVLLEQAQVTSTQADRIRTLLKRGTPLAEAIQKVPLVDPVKFASAQALAAHREEVQPADPVTAFTVSDIDDDLDLELDLVDDSEPVNIGQDKFRIENHGPVVPESAKKDFFEPNPTSDRNPSLSDEAEDMMPTWPKDKFMDELDMDLDLGTEEASEPPKLPPASGAKFGEEVNSILEEAFDVEIEIPGDNQAPSPREESSRKSVPASTAPAGRMPALADKEAYHSRTTNPKPVNLADDEGINLIREVNAIFISAIENKRRGFSVETKSGGDNLVHYDGKGAVDHRETLDEGMTEKVINRIKVMARIETWRRDSQQLGTFRVMHDGMTHRAYVTAESSEKGGESITVHLESE